MLKRMITLLAAMLVALGMMAGPALAAPAHQSIAAELKGGTATIMPAHVTGDEPGRAHQSRASSLKGEMAGFMPGHIGR